MQATVDSNYPLMLQQLHKQEFEEEEEEEQEKYFYYDSDIVLSDAGESDDDDSALHSDTELAFGAGTSTLIDNGRRSMTPYSVLTEQDIEKRLEDAIDSVCAVLHVTTSEASILLRDCEWCVSKVNDEWFADEARFRERVGLQLPPDLNNSAELLITDRSESVVLSKKRRVLQTCEICLEDVNQRQMIATSDFCGHRFCEMCWAALGEAAIADGPSCLSLRCPAPKCRSAVKCEDLILPLISEQSRNRYKWYLKRSYLETNRKVKWCPAPGCQFAIEIENMGEALQDVVCKCGHSFCWNCCEEPHKPVGCATVGKWMEKNVTESENVTWIMANSKPCPKCRRPIEKNHGCMHMTCSAPCKFEFCWLCLGAWSEHGENTGGFYQCNIYQEEKKQGKHTEEERARIEAKKNIKKYSHYYKRWALNNESMDKARHDLHSLQKSSGLIDKLREKLSLSSMELKFLSDAWLQIVECRRVLKWSYAYGYFIPEQDKAKKTFFECLQGQAENALEELHMCAEQEIDHFFHFTEDVTEQDFVNADTYHRYKKQQQQISEDMHRYKKQQQQISEDMGSFFREYRASLIGSTSVTRRFIESLVKALENNLADANTSTSPSSITVVAASSSSSNGVSKEEEDDDNDEQEEQGGYWSCRHCSFANPVQSSLVCSICHLPANEDPQN